MHYLSERVERRNKHSSKNNRSTRESTLSRQRKIKVCSSEHECKDNREREAGHKLEPILQSLPKLSLRQSPNLASVANRMRRLFRSPTALVFSHGITERLLVPEIRFILMLVFREFVFCGACSVGGEEGGFERSRCGRDIICAAAWSELAFVGIGAAGKVIWCRLPGERSDIYLGKHEVAVHLMITRTGNRGFQSIYGPLREDRSILDDHDRVR
jgi:hypothetical protein